MSASERIGIAAASMVTLLVGFDLLVTALSPSSHDAYGAGVRIAAYTVAALAAGTAAATFGWWREAVGRPWTLFCFEFALLLINYLMRRTAPDMKAVIDTTLIVANLAQISAIWLASRAFAAAGFAHVVSRGRRAAFTLAAALAAVLICQPAIVQHWRLFMAGTANAASTVSLASDLITFTLVAPLLMSALALRGGQLFWIFGFLTVSVFGWMFNQLGATIVAAVGTPNPDALRTTRLTGVLIAALFNAAAAMTQWISARRAMRGAVADV